MRRILQEMESDEVTVTSGAALVCLTGPVGGQMGLLGARYRVQRHGPFLRVVFPPCDPSELLRRGE